MNHRMAYVLLVVIAGCGASDGGTSSISAPSGGEQGTPSTVVDPCDPIDFDSAVESTVGVDMSRVGYLDRMVTYTPTVRSESRTLPLHIWYPTDETTGKPSLYQTVFERPNIFADASVAVQADAPIMIFSHGRRGFGQYSFFLAEYFAARGWVVAAMDHVGDRLEDQETPNDIFSVRPQDITATIDYLLELTDDDPLGQLTGETVVVAGHSFGGYTTFAVAGAQYDTNYLDEACSANPDRDWCINYALANNGLADGFKDDRIDLIISMAPGNQNLFHDGMRAIEIPTLLVTAAVDLNNSDEEDGDPYWLNLKRGVNRRLSFSTGGHFTFTNICDSIFAFYGEGNGCGTEFIETTQAYFIVNRFAEAFIQRHLFGLTEETGILDCDGGFHPHVQVGKP
ncbi:MAG: hypothetical protein VX589_06825 [Myxococcota bacterium]|nr:hypothetical protein [Myxococcota bacterium]